MNIDAWERSVLQTESWAENAVAVTIGRDGGSIVALTLFLLPLIVFCASTYWVWIKHNELKEKNIQTTIGKRSIGCCILFCCGCGTFLGLCLPIDETETNAQ